MAKTCAHCGQPLPGPDIRVDRKTHVMTINGIQTRLRPMAAALLACLARQPGETVTHEQLAIVAWGGDDGPVDERATMATHMKYLRMDLEPHGWTVRSVHGVGYRLERLGVVGRAAINQQWVPRAERCK